MENKAIRALELSHGTLSCRNIDRTRSFIRDFLGLSTVRHARPSFRTWSGTPKTFFIACVQSNARDELQGPENRWEIDVATADDVQAAWDAALSAREEWDIHEVTPLGKLDGFAWFALQDLDGNWWGISHRPSSWIDAVFDDKGSRGAL